MSKITSLAALAIFTALSSTATAGVITFDGLAGTNMPGHTSRNAATNGTGFTIFAANKSAVVGDFSFVDSFGHGYMGALIGGTQGFGSVAWNGTDFVRAFNTTMSSSTAFSVESVDLAQYVTSALHVSLIGTKQDGTTVQQLISKPLTNNALVGNDFATYSLTGFTDLKSLRFSTGTSNFALDNIRLAEQAVPEPGTLAILGLGLAGLALGRRRK